MTRFTSKCPCIMTIIFSNKIIFLCLFAVTVLSSCAVDPDMENVKGSIIKHFQGRDYAVTEIKISKIEQLPLGKREYMAPKKYVVSIAMITLESSDRGSLTFKDAVITIRGTDSHGIWSVDQITGIPIT